jgi:hypothetical protein
VYKRQAFDPVALVGSNVNVLLVNAALPPKTLGELVAFAHANPGKLLYSSAGSGTTGHLAGELFRLTARIDIRHDRMCVCRHSGDGSHDPMAAPYRQAQGARCGGTAARAGPRGKRPTRRV